jgi:hypothetical protein
MSGSSVVGASARWFRVEMTSVRKRFITPKDEAEWHRDWRREHQPEVNALKAKIERGLPSGWPLLEYDDKYEEELDALPDEPFRYRFQLGSADVIVVFRALPPKAQLREMHNTFARLVKR